MNKIEIQNVVVIHRDELVNPDRELVENTLNLKALSKFNLIEDQAKYCCIITGNDIAVHANNGTLYIFKDLMLGGTDLLDNMRLDNGEAEIVYRSYKHDMAQEFLRTRVYKGRENIDEWRNLLNKLYSSIKVNQDFHEAFDPQVHFLRINNPVSVFKHYVDLTSDGSKCYANSYDNMVMPTDFTFDHTLPLVGGVSSKYGNVMKIMFYMFQNVLYDMFHRNSSEISFMRLNNDLVFWNSDDIWNFANFYNNFQNVSEITKSDTEARIRSLIILRDSEGMQDHPMKDRMLNDIATELPTFH